MVVWEAAQFIKNAKQELVTRLFSYMTVRGIIHAAMDEITRRRAGENTDTETETETETDKADEPVEKPDPLTMQIAEVQPKDTVAGTEYRWGLEKLHYARERTLRTRAAVYQLLGQIDDDEFVNRAVKLLQHKDNKFWRTVTNNTAMTLGQLLNNLEKGDC